MSELDELVERFVEFLGINEMINVGQILRNLDDYVEGLRRDYGMDEQQLVMNRDGRLHAIAVELLSKVPEEKRKGLNLIIHEKTFKNPDKFIAFIVSYYIAKQCNEPDYFIWLDQAKYDWEKVISESLEEVIT